MNPYATQQNLVHFSESSDAFHLYSFSLIESNSCHLPGLMPTLHLPQKLFISGNIYRGLHHPLCLPPAHLEVAATVAFVCFGPARSDTMLIDLLTSLRATNPTFHVAFA